MKLVNGYGKEIETYGSRSKSLKQWLKRLFSKRYIEVKLRYDLSDLDTNEEEQ